jgi:hypothetical protein
VVAVSELVSGLDAELVRLGYRISTMMWYRGCWRRLERFFTSHGVQEFSLDLAMMWVDEACDGFFEKEQAGTLKPTDVYLFRIAQMLNDFAVHGAIPRLRDILGHVDPPALESVYADVVNADLAEWNQNPELLSWLARLEPARIMRSVRLSPPPPPAQTSPRYA